MCNTHTLTRAHTMTGRWERDREMRETEITFICNTIQTRCTHTISVQHWTICLSYHLKNICHSIINIPTHRIVKYLESITTVTPVSSAIIVLCVHDDNQVSLGGYPPTEAARDHHHLYGFKHE